MEGNLLRTGFLHCGQIVKLDTVLTAKSDSEVMPCLQSYQGLKIVRSLVY